MTPHNPTAEHIVLDLETLSTKPNAAVISIGAVALDSEGNFLGEFHQAINPDQPGRDIDPATVQWWDSQTFEAQEASYKAKDTVTATTGMSMFSAWVCCVGLQGQVKMWGNGSSFDCTILSSLFDQYPEMCLPKPWAWWDDRDMNTILDAFPEAKDVGEFVGVKHHALHDARHEAKQLAKALGLMAEARGTPVARVQMPVELGPDGKEWTKTMAGYAHVDTMLPRADGETRAPYWHAWALRGAFVAGAEWQEQRTPTAQAEGNPMDGPDSGVALNRVVWLLSEALGIVPQGSEKITVKISEVVEAACQKLHPLALPTRPQVADTLLAEVAGNFTREDDLPNELLRRIDAYLTSEGYTE